MNEASVLDAKNRARRIVEKHAGALVELSRRIHACPELGFEEIRASGWLREALRDAGLAVEANLRDLRTAFAARAGRGSLHVAICAEYDALPGVGHACGHNLIAAMAVGAAIALRDLTTELDLSVSVIGTPAEEQGNGKALLLERGAFDGVHAACLVHPAPVDVLEPPLLAFSEFEVRYEGCSADALDGADRGASAESALVVAQVAIGLLRQSLRPTDRVHGVTLEGGGDLTRIADRAMARYMVRGRTVAELAETEARVRLCFEAGALATGTRLRLCPYHDPYAEMRHDHDLAAVYRRNAEALGRWFPDLGDFLAYGTGSSDMGNVSQALPSIHPAIGIESFPAVNHQPEFAAHCVTPAAERALLDGAIALAWTAIDVSRDVELRRRLIRGGDR